MHRIDTKASFTARCLVVASAGIVGLACPIADAADYELVVSGTLVSTTSDSSTFDGTNHGTLPPVLDLAALTGGSFRSTFRFSTVTPDAGDSAFYELTPSSGMTFDLLNSTGAVVHHGSNPSDAIAIVANDTGGAPYTVDQVLLGSNVNSISGAITPARIYSPPGDLISSSDVSFFGNVSGGTQYLTDLSIPTNASTYLAFPDRVFDLLIEFGDGDYFNRVNPYQLIDTTLQYQITAVAVTPVPEAGLVFIPAMSALVLRRQRAARHSSRD